MSETLLQHATAVAIDGEAVLLRGPSGAGKSDLALRLIDRGARLVADDQTLLRRVGDRVIAAAPPTIAGLIEIRGIGIVAVDAADAVPLFLIADLIVLGVVERMPERTCETVLGVPVPLIGLAEAGALSHFGDGGVPAGAGCHEIAFPVVNDEHAYALEISGHSMEPAYRNGDIIVASPSAPMRRGDRVVVRTKSGEVLAKELKRKTAKAIELKSLNAQHGDHTLAITDIAWIARILWASQ